MIIIVFLKWKVKNKRTMVAMVVRIEMYRKVEEGAMFEDQTAFMSLGRGVSPHLEISECSTKQPTEEGNNAIAVI